MIRSETPLSKAPTSAIGIANLDDGVFLKEQDGVSRNS